MQCDSAAVAQLLRRRLTQTGWSVRDVAHRARLAPATVEALLDAGVGVVPRRATLVRLARGLDLGADEVLAAAAGQPARFLDVRDQQLVDDIRRLDAHAREVVEHATRRLGASSAMAVPDARAG
jgi:transcriptional regulator with XRE-family HTH domain